MSSVSDIVTDDKVDTTVGDGITDTVSEVIEEEKG